VDYVQDEPEQMHDTRIVMVFATEWKKVKAVARAQNLYRTPVSNGEQMYYNSVAFAHDGNAHYLLLHEAFHAFCDAFRRAPYGSWFSEGAAQDTASYVMDSDYSRLAVFVFDRGAGNIFRNSILDWRRNPPGVEGFTKWGPDYNPGATIQHFFKDDPLRNQLWKIWSQEMRRKQLTQTRDKQKYQVASDELLYSLFGSKNAFRDAWHGWLKSVKQSTLAFGSWGRDGNMAGLSSGKFGYMVFNLPPEKKPVRDSLVIDYFPPKPSPLVGPVRRGGDEPSVGCLIAPGRKGKGKLGLCLGVDFDRKGRPAGMLKVLIQGNSQLVFDGSALNLDKKIVNLPEAMVRSLAGSEHPRLGLTVRIGRRQLFAMVRHGEWTHESSIAISDAVRSHLLSKGIGLASEDSARGGLVPYFDDGRPAYEEFSKPAPANRWRNPGDAEFGWVTKAAWRLGDKAPASLTGFRTLMYRTAAAPLTTQQSTLDKYHKALPAIVQDVAKVESEKKQQALADLSGCRLSATWEKASAPGRVAIVAVIRNPGADSIQATVNFSVDPATAVAEADASERVEMKPRSQLRIRKEFARTDRVSVGYNGFHVAIRAKIQWYGQAFVLDEQIADRPWPQLTMNSDPVIHIEGDTATVVTELYSDDNWPINGKIKYQVMPQDAVENSRIDLKVNMPSHEHRLFKQSFKVLDKTRPLRIKVTGDLLIDDERVILNQQVVQKP